MSQRPPGAGGARLVLHVQALEYLVTGAWPLVRLESFERVAGRQLRLVCTSEPHDRHP